MIEPGIYDLASADYHALPHLSRSTIHTLLTKSPAHAKAGMSDKQNGAMRLGTVWHKLVLGVGDEYEISPYDEYRSDEAKAWRDEQIEAGRTPIKRKEFDIAQAMADRVREQISHHEIGDVFALPGKAEATAIWRDKDVWCRALIDWLPEDIHALHDLKSTECASPEAFRRVAFSEGYHLQAAFYTRGVAALSGRDVQEIPFRFIVQERSPPHFVNVLEMSGESLQVAHDQIDRALRIWHRCEQTGQWPGYDKIIGGKNLIDPPGWMVAQEQMQQLIDKSQGFAA